MNPKRRLLKMNTKIYKSAILNAARLSGNKTKSSDNLAEVREIFKTCGVEFPKGTIDEVKGILKTNDYTSWETNTKNDIQSLADNGYPSVAIFNDKVVIIAPKFDEEYADISAAATVDALPDEPAEYFSYTRTSSNISTLDRLKGKFPGGKYWNHMGMSQDNSDGYTNTPCTDHSYPFKYCNTFAMGGKSASQCAGFAFRCGAFATNQNSYNWPTLKNSSAIDSLKPGDIVRYKTDNKGNEHSIYVTSVVGDSVYYGDCNGLGTSKRCVINWDGHKTKSFLKTNFVSMRKAPYQLDT